MNRYASKSEVLHALDQGGEVHSHRDGLWWIEKKDGETARIRYSLWKILTSKRHIEKTGRMEGRAVVWKKRAELKQAKPSKKKAPAKVVHVKDCHLGENWRECPACLEQHTEDSKP